MSGAFEGAWLILKAVLNQPDIDGLVATLRPDLWSRDRSKKKPSSIEVLTEDWDKAHELIEDSGERAELYLDTADYFRTGGYERMRELLDVIGRAGGGILGSTQNRFDQQTGQGRATRMDPLVFSRLLTDPEAYEILGLENPTETGTVMGDFIEDLREKKEAVPLGGLDFDAATGQIGVMSLTPGMNSLGIGGHLMGLALQNTDNNKLFDRLFTGAGARAFDRLGTKAIGGSPQVNYIAPKEDWEEPRLELIGNDFSYGRPLGSFGQPSWNTGSLTGVLDPEDYTDEQQERMVEIEGKTYNPNFPGRYPFNQEMSLRYTGNEATPISDIELFDQTQWFRDHPYYGRMVTW